MNVTAAIFRDGNSVLLMRRAQNQPCAGAWEYPGGKFEPGENGPSCLARELNEELGINAEIGDLVTIAHFVTDTGREINLYAYEITVFSGEIELRVHDQMHWVRVDELLAHPQLPADHIISQKLVELKK